MGGESKFKNEYDALELRYGIGKVSVYGQYFCNLYSFVIQTIVELWPQLCGGANRQIYTE